MGIEFNERIPIYIQIMNLIKKDIITGQLKKGDKLLSVREMAEKLNVNPNTIQRVYQELEREGVIFTQRGMGTFITQDNKRIQDIKDEMASDIVISYINGMKSIGFNEKEIADIISNYVKKGEI